MPHRPEPAAPPPRARAPLLPAKFDPTVAALLFVGFGILYIPAYFGLATLIWSTDEQGHGPIILALSAWLLFSLRHRVAEMASAPALKLGWTLLIVALLFYAFGTAQHILLFQVGSQIFVLIALLLMFGGFGALRAAWFPLFFLIFMIPLPEALVATVTAPLKSAVSAVASNLLYALGYPVGRSGVIITVGQYQLLVADACAGLNSMFTLEALGMLYMNLMKYTSAGRNVALAVMLVPISFMANIVRVMILVLVTYHFGDEAGQGFVHGFAGMVLFMAALGLMLTADSVLGFFFRAGKGQPK